MAKRVFGPKTRRYHRARVVTVFSQASGRWDIGSPQSGGWKLGESLG